MDHTSTVVIKAVDLLHTGSVSKEDVAIIKDGIAVLRKAQRRYRDYEIDESILYSHVCAFEREIDAVVERMRLKDDVVLAVIGALMTQDYQLLYQHLGAERFQEIVWPDLQEVLAEKGVESDFDFFRSFLVRLG